MFQWKGAPFMKLLVDIDLRAADMAAFEAYEAAVLPLLAEHGAVLERRLRAVDDSAETHLIDVPSQAALDAYLADPRRAALAPAWRACGAVASHREFKDLALRPQS